MSQRIPDLYMATISPPAFIKPIYITWWYNYLTGKLHVAARDIIWRKSSLIPGYCLDKEISNLLSIMGYSTIYLKETDEEKQD